MVIAVCMAWSHTLFDLLLTHFDYLAGGVRTASVDPPDPCLDPLWTLPAPPSDVRRGVYLLALRARSARFLARHVVVRCGKGERHE